MIRSATTSVSIRASRETVWALLNDVEQSLKWLPGVTGARILTREGDISVVELSHRGVPTVLEIVASPPTGARFSQVDPVESGGISGGWTLRDGVGDSLNLEVEVNAVTPLLAFGAGRRLRASVEAAIAAVATRLQRPPTEKLSTYRRALAIIRRGDVIEAHIGDEIVELLRIGEGG